MRRLKIRTASVILAVVVTLSVLVGGTVYAAQDSLPGDALYPVKLATERAGIMLRGDDVVRAERALSFADRRVREMIMLTEREQVRYLWSAAGKYEQAMNMTLARIQLMANKRLRTGNITAVVAEATTHHLLVLDTVWDTASSEGKLAIVYAREVSQRGQENALAALARNSPVRATELNLAAMEGRLNRIRARVQNAEAVEIALQQFEAMAEFGEEISRIAQEMGLNIADVEELVAEATARHLEVLAEVWEEVPEQARPAIERAMANLQIRHQKRIQTLEQKGIQAPPPPVIPERVQERIEERIREREQQGAPDGTTPPGQGVPAGAWQQNDHGTT